MTVALPVRRDLSTHGWCSYAIERAGDGVIANLFFQFQPYAVPLSGMTHLRSVRARAFRSWVLRRGGGEVCAASVPHRELTR